MLTTWIAMATNLMVDMGSPTSTTYRWSIATCTLSRIISELLAIFFVLEFPISHKRKKFKWGHQKARHCVRVDRYLTLARSMVSAAGVLIKKEITKTIKQSKKRAFPPYQGNPPQSSKSNSIWGID